jgi:hypothetical protein
VLTLFRIEHSESLIRRLLVIEKNDRPVAVNFYNRPSAAPVGPHLVRFHAEGYITLMHGNGRCFQWN